MALQPGTELLTQFGGIKKFMKRQHARFTDSRGFQMVSLSRLSRVKELCVTFQSQYDARIIDLTPEGSMRIQNAIGADIIMQLDDMASGLTPSSRIKEAMHRSIRWFDRCIAAHARREEQTLFPILQGGLFAFFDDPHLSYQVRKLTIRKGPLILMTIESQMWLMNSLCYAILNDNLEEHINQFAWDLRQGDRPAWAMSALAAVGIRIAQVRLPPRISTKRQ